MPELLLVAVKVEPLISVFQEFHTVPFEGEVYYKEFFDINDFAEYYRDKEIYDVEKLNDTALLITENLTAILLQLSCLTRECLF